MISTQNIQNAVSLLGQNQQNCLINAIPEPIQKIENESTEKQSGISLLVSMDYVSLSGHEKNRDVLIRRVIQSKKEIYLDVLVMNIRMPRLIKVSNIREIRDITSGHIYTNPCEFIQNRLGVDVGIPKQETLNNENGFKLVIERCSHEMVVLMYLTALDGHRDKREREKVLEYIQTRTSDLTYEQDELNEYLVSLAPDEVCFSSALSHVLNKGQKVVQPFLETVLEVIMANGKIDDKERAFLIRIMDLLEQDGYEISLPI